MGVDGEREKDRVDAVPEDLSRATAKLAIAQVRESVGYEHYRDPSLESLSDLAVQYILQVGKTATSFANLTGRSQCNVFDMVLALEDLSGDCSRERMWSEGSCVADSVKLREIIDFVNSGEEVHFVQPLPRFPVVLSDRNRKLIPSFVQMGENPPGKHLPVWLPAFPDPHTYKETLMWVQRTLDPLGDKIKQSKQRRKTEKDLLSLQQKLICRISSANPMWGDMDTVKGEFRAEEKEDRNGLLVVDAFAPSIEAAKDACCNGIVAERKNKRPVILFKFRTVKKLFGQPLELSLANEGEEKWISFLCDEERDDKRRRAEFIIRQCIENPVDLNQL